MASLCTSSSLLSLHDQLKQREYKHRKWHQSNTGILQKGTYRNVARLNAPAIFIPEEGKETRENHKKNGCEEEAFRLYVEMLGEGKTTNQFTFGTVLSALAGLGGLQEGKIVHGQVVKTGIC
ncbi:hypothetical protein SUGI_0207160 [Cryptomeria japonica]|nr:hypothetical protein SUGI_0207160 [Cryptomeria japonica]